MVQYLIEHGASLNTQTEKVWREDKRGEESSGLDITPSHRETLRCMYLRAPIASSACAYCWRQERTAQWCGVEVEVEVEGIDD